MNNDSSRAAGKIPHHDDPSVKKGKNYILAIGIDDYTHHRPLKNAVADATDFAQVMTTRYGFEHLHEPLYNDKATQRNIQKALGKCESLGAHDRLIVFYSGHGWYKKAAKLGYLVPIDAEDDPNTDFIPVDFITSIFRAVEAHHILLIVDCCFGGSFGLERDVTVAMTNKKIGALDAKKSRMVLSSGGVELVSDGLVADNNSPFSKPLIGILTENKAPQMAFSEFFNLLCTKTIWNTNQVPQYKPLQYLGHDDGELALFCTDLESPEERAFNKAMETQSISLLEKFIRDFPTSARKAAIRTILKEKRAALAWAKVENSKHIEDFDEFIDDFPDSPFIATARQKIVDLDAIDVQERVQQQQRDETERARKAEIARQEAEQKARDRQEIARKQREQEAEEQLWRDCQAKRTPSVYLDKFPKGRFAEQAFNLKLDIEAAEKQKRIAEDNARKENDRLAQQHIERKKQEAIAQKNKEEAARKKQQLEEQERQKQALLKQLEPEMIVVKAGAFNREYTYEEEEKTGFLGLSSKKVSKTGTQKVTLTKDFSIGKYQLTVVQFAAFIKDTNHKTDADKDGGSYIWTASAWEKKAGVNWQHDMTGNAHTKSTEHHPVIHVSWNDATAFCDWLSKKLTKKYRLPTEAEWEFAARGGTQSKGYEYSGSNNVDEVAWHYHNSENKTHPVGQKKANELGIHDMSGNVWEWCQDWYADYESTASVTNPTGATTGSDRVYRGGGWGSNPEGCRSADRGNSAPTNRGGSLGFRLAISSLQ